MTSAAENVLDGLDARARYEEIDQKKPIEHTFTYRSAAGRLQGHDELDAQQTIKLPISPPSKNTDQEHIRARNKIVEAGLATLIERYETFGPFFQYPRTFVVGPSQFQLDSNRVIVAKKRGPEENMPALRDVDALIWMRPLDGSGRAYLLGHARFFHDDFAPGEVKARWVEYRSGPGNLVPEDDAKTTLGSILGNFFADGNGYRVIQAPSGDGWNGVQNIVGANTDDEAHLTLLWKANEIARERDLNVSTTAPSKDEKTRALAVALVGNDPRVVPSDETQRDRPVPIGLVDNDRLIEVLENIVLKRTREESSFNGEISSRGYVLSDDDLA